MPRPSATSTTPTRTPAPAARRASTGYLTTKPKTTGRFVAMADDPLDALAADVLVTNAKLGQFKSTAYTAQGKPVGGIGIFGARRAPARRAAFRQPPR